MKLKYSKENPKNNFKELGLLTILHVLSPVGAAMGYVFQLDVVKVFRDKGKLFQPALQTFSS